MPSRHSLSALAAATLLVAFTAGCGGSSDESSDAPGQSPSSDANVSAPTDSPAESADDGAPAEPLSVSEAQRIVDAWAMGTPELCEVATDEFVAKSMGQPGDEQCGMLVDYRRGVFESDPMLVAEVIDVVSNRDTSTGTVALSLGGSESVDLPVEFRSTQGRWKLNDI